MEHEESYGTSRRVAMGALFAALAVIAMGSVIALDVGQSNQGGTLTGIVTATAPTVFWFDIADASNTSLNGAQINVLATSYLNVSVNAPNGWTNIAYISFHLWYNNGSASLGFASQGAGANYAANLSYHNPGRATPYMTDFAVAAGGNIDYFLAGSGNRTNVAGQNYTFHVGFRPHAQFHHALGGTPSGSGYANLRSWNAEVVVRDTNANVVTVAKNAAGNFVQFGVFQHTSISLGTTTWNFGTLVPGGTGTTGAITITYTSNGNYSANVTLLTLLTDVKGDTIAASAVSVSGSVISSTAFGGTGPSHTIYLLGASGTFILQSASGDSLTTTMTFSVTVPLGTPTGTYSATIVATLNQQTPP